MRQLVASNARRALHNGQAMPAPSRHGPRMRPGATQAQPYFYMVVHTLQRPILSVVERHEKWEEAGEEQVFQCRERDPRHDTAHAHGTARDAPTHI
jgi:hypothetical protein